MVVPDAGQIVPKTQFGEARMTVCSISVACRVCCGRLIPWLLCCALMPISPAHSEESLDMSELIGLDLVDLLNVSVTTVTRTPETLSRTSAAVHVISNEDIRRSGMTTIPEILRTVPGVQVQQIDANEWAISIRGFNSVFSDKLLVMIDGRTVYTPLFAGVNWDVQDVVLDDVERIEVVLGPGGTLWGSNAVNGIISIVTKAASDTQGGLLTIGTDTDEPWSANWRFGGELAENAHYRWYAKLFSRDDYVDATGDDAGDEWSMGRGGFRIDWGVNSTDNVVVQGDVYAGKEDDLTAVTDPNVIGTTFVNDESKLRGANLLARWTRQLSDAGDLSLQVYYDRTDRDTAIFEENRDTVDIDFQHRFALADGHELTWGAGYRYTRKDLDGSFTLQFDPSETERHLGSVFVQDKFDIIDNRVQCIVGSKLEHNEFSGFEFQPGIRLLWTPNSRHSIWGSVARAVVTPSEAVTEIRINTATVPVFTPPGGFQLRQVRVIGDDDVGAQDLVAYEMGHRATLTTSLTVETAVFVNDYRRLSDTTVSADGLISTFTNDARATAYGGEIIARYKVNEDWLCSLSYAGHRIDYDRDRRGRASVQQATANEVPSHQIKARSLIDLPWNLELDTSLYYDENLSSPDVPAFFRLDIRVGWRPIETIDMSFGVRNALDDRHPEFVDSLGFRQSSEIERSVYGRISWRF